MATQNGPVIWEKTFDCGVSFYKRLGRGCVRMKSNLTAERWRKDPVFAGSRLSAACMALGSKLGSAVYQTIPLQHRRYPHYKELVGIAQKTLRQGYNIQQVKKVLHFAVARYLRKLQATDPNRKPERSAFAATLSLKAIQVFKKEPQWGVPQFTLAPLSKPAVKTCLTRMAPRGSPTAFIGCTQNRKSFSRYLPMLGQSSCRNQPFKMAGLVMPISTTLPDFSPKQASKTPPKHRKVILGSDFLPSRVSIAL